VGQCIWGLVTKKITYSVEIPPCQYHSEKYNGILGSRLNVCIHLYFQPHYVLDFAFIRTKSGKISPSPQLERRENYCIEFWMLNIPTLDPIYYPYLLNSYTLPKSN